MQSLKFCEQQPAPPLLEAGLNVGGGTGAMAGAFAMVGRLVTGGTGVAIGARTGD